jgi:hypothetical protein
MVTAFSYPTPPEVGLVTFRSRIASYIFFEGKKKKRTGVGWIVINK